MYDNENTNIFGGILKYINKQRGEFELEVENDGISYRKTHKKKLDIFS